MSESNWGTDEEIWQTISPPLIPAVQDIDLIRRTSAAALAAAGSAPRVLVLGVTPALIAADWLAGAEIHAVDYDDVMIELLWKPREGAYCHQARWQEMPFPDAHFDLVIGDCSFNALPGLADYDDVLREISRVRRPSAPVVARFFMQTEPRLTLPGLIAGRAGMDGWSSAARRLAIAIAAAQADGNLNLSDIPARIREQCGDVDEFLAAMGQSPREIERAKSTYEIEQDLNYPSKSQINAQIGGYFPDISFAYPAYDCGALCPIVRFA